MSFRFLVTVMILVVLALGFTTIGFAYTASTENSDNSALSEYVVLEQTTYSFSTHDISFDTIHSDVGTVYYINDADVVIEPTGDVLPYSGVLIGTDTFKATLTGIEATNIDVSIKTFGFGFNDFSAKTLDWRYVMKIIEHNDQTKISYAVYDGKPPSGADELADWNIVVKENEKWVYKTKLNIKVDTLYDTELYFAGYHGEKTDGTTMRSSGSEVLASSNVNIKAIWTAKYPTDHKVTLKSGIEEVADIVRYVTDNGTYVVPENKFVAPGDKVFLGWRGGSFKMYQPGDRITNVSADIMLTAQWADKVTISFSNDNKLGGTMPSVVIPKGSSITVPNSHYTSVPPNYYFYCWSVGTGNSVTYYSPGDVISNVTENMTLTVVCKSNSYTVSFYSSDNPGEVAAWFMIGSGSRATLPTEEELDKMSHITHEGKKLLGWTTNGNATEPDRMPGESIVISSDLGLYAIWTSEVTVTYGDITTKVAKGSYYTLPYGAEPPSIPGVEWRLAGWSVTVNKWDEKPWNVMLSFTSPVDSEGYIIKNGTIKIVYDSDSENETPEQNP